jgi:hypothetical protein
VLVGVSSCRAFEKEMIIPSAELKTEKYFPTDSKYPHRLKVFPQVQSISNGVFAGKWHLDATEVTEPSSTKEIERCLYLNSLITRLDFR